MKTDDLGLKTKLSLILTFYKYPTIQKEIRGKEKLVWKLFHSRHIKSVKYNIYEGEGLSILLHTCFKGNSPK